MHRPFCVQISFVVFIDIYNICDIICNINEVNEYAENQRRFR